MPSDKKQQFNIYLPPELIREVKHASVDAGGSLSDFVAEALAAHIRNEQATSGTKSPEALTFMAIVYVRDVARALPFYQALGFQIALQERTGNWIQMRMGGSMLGLHEGPEPSRRIKSDGERGIELSLIVHELLEQLLARLEAAGFPTAHPIIDESFGRSVQLEAPEGLLIQANELEIDLYV